MTFLAMLFCIVTISGQIGKMFLLTFYFGNYSGVLAGWRRKRKASKVGV